MLNYNILMHNFIDHLNNIFIHLVDMMMFIIYYFDLDYDHNRNLLSYKQIMD